MLRNSSTCLLTVVLAVSFVSCGTCNPRPLITSISPQSTTAGGGQFTLTVNGNNFVPSSQIFWNGSSLVTTFVNHHQLTAVVPAADIVSPGTVVVLVSNPSGSTMLVFTFNSSNNGCGGNSGGVTFTINS